MPRYLWIVPVFLFIVLAMLTFYTLNSDTPPPATTPVTEALGEGDIEGYVRAYEPRTLQFPDDHGPHPDFRNEWWYLTGNLEDETGRHFGYQLTLFRIALSPSPVKKDSTWRTRQLYMGHFAVTDTANKHHQGFERFSRGAAGLAGAQAVPFRVWLEDWSLSSAGEHSGGTVFPLRVQAREDDIRLDLTLTATKPLILQGDRGLSQKSSEPGNASYYYSYTRLATQGSLRLEGQEFQVSGSSWLDREWSTSALGPDQAGWDWFALHLDDGRELMFYRLRLKAGGTDPYSSGTLVTAGGRKKPLGHDDVRLEVLDSWISPYSGDRYPIRWRLSVPAEDLELTIFPRVEDQEMSLSVHYWEGAVQAQGQAAGRAITGMGYLEMTRYEGSLSRHTIPR